MVHVLFAFVYDVNHLKVRVKRVLRLMEIKRKAK